MFFALSARDFTSHPNLTFRIMDQATHNKIASFICGILASQQESEVLPSADSVSHQPDVRAAAPRSPDLPGAAAAGGGDALDEMASERGTVEE